MDQHKRREGGQPSLDNRPYISSLYPYLELSQNHVLGRVKRCFYILTRIFEFKEIKSLPVWFEKCIRLNFFFYWNSRSQVFYKIGTLKNCSKLEVYNFIERENSTQVHSCKFWKIFKNTFFKEQLQRLLLHLLFSKIDYVLTKC